jgi:hypothetical protein
LFFATLAQEYLTILFAKDITIKPLEYNFLGVFGMHYTVIALIEFNVAHGSIVTHIFLQLIV